MASVLEIENKKQNFIEIKSGVKTLWSKLLLIESLFHWFKSYRKFGNWMLNTITDILELHYGCSHGLELSNLREMLS
jgi:hypothetical protein